MLEQLLRQYGYLMVYLGTLVEPDATLVASTFLAHRGYLNVQLVWIVATLATVTIGEAFFWLGRRKGREFVDRVAHSHRYYGRLRAWMARRGGLLVLFSRFLWGTRLIITTASGATGFSPVRFFVLDTLGAMIWVTTIGTAGVAIARGIASMVRHLRRYEDVIALGLLAVIALIDLWRRTSAVHALEEANKNGAASDSIPDDAS